MARCIIKATDAGLFPRIKDLVAASGVTVLLTSERRHFLVTADLPADLERAVVDAGAIVAPETTYELERAPKADASAPPSPKQALMARLRRQPALGIDWTREELYGDGG